MPRILSEHLAEMLLAENQQVIKAFAAKCPDEPVRK
jgi:hypothetical protein